MPLQPYEPSNSELSNCDDNVASRGSFEGAAGWEESREVVQGLEMPGQFGTVPHKQAEEDTHSHRIVRLMSPYSSITTTYHKCEPVEIQAEVLADGEEPVALCDPGSASSPAVTTDDPAAGSDDRSIILSQASRHPGKYGLKEYRKRWGRLPQRTMSKNAKIVRHKSRLRVAKRWRANMTKHYQWLHQSRGAVSGLPSKQSSKGDQPESGLANWKENEASSIGNSLATIEICSSHSVRRLPAAIPDEQLTSKNEPLPAEPVSSQDSAEEYSSRDETEVEEADVSDIEQPHPLDSQRDRLVTLLLERYLSYRKGSQQHDTDSRRNGTGSGSKNTNGQAQSNTGSGKQTAGQTRKRKSGSQDDEGIEDNDEEAPRRRKRPKATTEETKEHQSFACPFSKKSPSKYRRCYRYDLKRIRDVKQHLRRCHRRAVYCPVCSETFQSEEARDAHVRQRTCIESPGFTIEGISEIQAQSLSGKCSSKASAEQQWFHVFDIGFPGHTHPRSPYVDNNLSQELQSFRDYASVEGPSIIMEQLRGVHDWNEQDTAFLHQVLSDGIERIADQWSHGLASESNTELDTTSSMVKTAQNLSQNYSARQPVTAKVAKATRDWLRRDATDSSLNNMLPQPSGSSSCDESQPSGVVPQTESSIFELGMELFDLSMFSTGTQVAAASGDVEYSPDLWTLQYGPSNAELAIM